MFIQERSEQLVALDPIVGVITALPISREFDITGQGSLNMRVDLAVTGVTIGGAITVILQTGNAAAGWSAVKSVSITADGAYTIKMLNADAADAPYLPLAAHGRLVVTTTNAGDEVTVGNVIVTQGAE